MGLSLAALRKLNVLRCVNGFGHDLHSWSCAEWGNATAGEVGEACNIAKKILRIRDGIQRNNTTMLEYRERLASEIADMVIYADLWAASENIDLEAAIVATFNKKSAELGCEYRLVA